jgi:low affinity Fe/Cu permease
MHSKTTTPGGFHRFATHAARRAGNSSTFGLAVLVVVGWAVTGPLFGFSDTWQLVINTSTTIVTFLMVFLIQNTQNRESMATQMKLDEIIRATLGAHNVLLDLEERSDAELSRQRDHYANLAAQARADVVGGRVDTGVADDARP